MTHDHDVDDGDLEIEEWMKADAALAEQGYDEYDRIYLWRSLRTPGQVEQDDLIESVMQSEGCTAERAHAILRALAGKEAL